MSLDPSKVVVDPSAPNFQIVATVDVSSPTAAKEQGKYIVYKAQPASSEAWIITTMHCFAWSRTNVGDTSEGVQRILCADGDAFLLFEPLVGSGAAFGLSPFTIAAWTTAAGATSADVKTGSGIPLLSDAPFDASAISEGNGMRRFIVPPGQPLTVLFSVIPDAIANALPGRYAIGGVAPLAGALQRVDYVGVIARGSKMSRAYYDSLVKRQEQQERAR
jgi:hypothetical protein